MTFSQMSESICSILGIYSIWLVLEEGSVSSLCFFANAFSERYSESTKN